MHLFTRRGHDWTDRYRAIAAAAATPRAKSFTLDGEAVVTGEDDRALPIGAVSGLDQGQEPELPGDGALP